MIKQTPCITITDFVLKILKDGVCKVFLFKTNFVNLMFWVILENPLQLYSPVHNLNST